MLKHVILFMALAISIINSSVNDSCVSEGHEAVTGYDGFIKEAKDICVSSLQAVKDYVAAQVKKKLASYIRTCLNSAIEPDTLTKGKGVSESCKIKSKTAMEKNKSGPFWLCYITSLVTLVCVTPSLMSEVNDHCRSCLSSEATANNAEAWRKWWQRLELYLLASGLDRSEEKRKVAILLHSIGPKGLEIFNTFNISLDEAKIKDVKAKFDLYFEPRKNLTMCRYAISADAKKVKKFAKIVAKKLKAPKHKRQSKKTASLKSKSAPKNAYTTKK
ncbi:hypothetical protein SFRURICE_002348 [Spodoptera frugiperda]|uniref:SFRICE_013205 n=1 Tax=Spodoptera frugiperda TaxID=7108 RepID=A0A2H1VIE6_SPOFR|nr:hypothetical protein SFRURICE_002348 [Spodoptera frugiperda]